MSRDFFQEQITPESTQRTKQLKEKAWEEYSIRVELKPSDEIWMRKLILYNPNGGILEQIVHSPQQMNLYVDLACHIIDNVSDENLKKLEESYMGDSPRPLAHWQETRELYLEWYG